MDTSAPTFQPTQTPQPSFPTSTPQPVVPTPPIAPVETAIPPKEGRAFKLLFQLLLYVALFLAGFVAAKMHTLVTSL